MAIGKVYLVGAGPGDPELLTIKGRKRLMEADVVLFDRLLDSRMLNGVTGELIDVGKNAGRHKLKQEEINQLLIEKAKEGKIVVRLKGGDPYLFGRGGEEAIACRDWGIPFEVVPGVTSAIAAPELAGIPVTHRKVASALTIVTGHEEPGKSSPLDWRAMAGLDGTLVVLMGVSRLEENTNRLIEAGKSPQTPAAMVEKGGWPDQRLVSGTLGDIAERAKEENVQSPAILVVGDVVRLAEVLAPERIAILRPAGQQEESVELAERYGFIALSAPAIALEKNPLPEDLQERIAAAECVAFTSANGVHIALGNMAISGALAEKKIVSIGPKTKQALNEYNIQSEMPESYSSEGLERMLKGRYKSILFLRSAQGSQYLSDGLREAGILVDDIPLYGVVNSSDPRLDRLIERAGEVDIFAFTSSSTARNLLERARSMGREEPLREALARATVAAIGKPTAQELSRLGVAVDVIPERFTFEAMLAALVGRKRL
ncbi:MAG: uroporphyrinogen-III C-methyltransferase [Methanothrix sp.]|uniref:uroporphyrinogen-III C-methyltransferase n=1 Tax=Methanothrix sp. TaxID=90426 RepID=UPI0025F78EBC|nr:uroporphyrinogen-III C-methyltransferase [Methanothrix sp.]MCK9407380.1 uroporphyrinogen-III C-methyltransferase [Methanothrix sp.]